MFKIFLVIVIVLSGIWSYRWYLGKTAPSVIDNTVASGKEAIAYFAGGCFWCVESDYEKLDGVKTAVSGYMGGKEQRPSYNDVAAGRTSHRETVKVVYDPNQVTYRELVLDLLSHTDPTDADGSFYDRGNQYTSAIYYGNDDEKQIAEELIKDLDMRGIFDKPIVTSVLPAGEFWVAEDYHQDYYKKSSLQYKYYRNGSGRDKFIEDVWGSVDKSEILGDNHDTHKDARKYVRKDVDESESRWTSFEKPSDEELRSILTSLQYDITQKDGTETPFDNEYWDNHEEGIYVDIVSGEPLFSSTDKFDSGTGWPSFLKPLDKDFVVEKNDYKLIIPRIEIRSKYADSHLGHIIMDGPKENNYVRYCMNSAALRFVPKEDLEEQGLGEYLHLFEE